MIQVIIDGKAADVEQDINLAVADVNGDGKVNMKDSGLIAQRWANNIDKFPVEE